ncbi:helix-turn-helix domain-containing protein [Desulforhopalus singaporensis]|uniref:helix-turn-helix domain-containing protein n=1 Tax=Desulforhopalus singaporensis TaxID=91360 RepID=UPI000B840F13|nr:helix-turn-helix transcriptional regulator [Desulforhopalus singaporensis]
MQTIIQFSKRLQYLVDSKKISQKQLGDDLGFHKSQVSKWLSGTTGTPRRTTLLKISSYFECDIIWLETGEGEPFPKIQTALPAKTADFRAIKQKQTEADTLAEQKRLFFKQQAAGYLDELIDYIGEIYGFDREGVEEFMEKLHALDENYRSWKREKKPASDNSDNTLNSI